MFGNLDEFLKLRRQFLVGIEQVHLQQRFLLRKNLNVAECPVRKSGLGHRYMHLRVRGCLVVGIQAQLAVGRFDSNYRTLPVRSAA